MSKKKSSKASTFLLGAFCAAALGLVAVLMPLAPFVGVTVSLLGQTGTDYVNGFDLIFGDSSNSGNLTAWILVLVGAIVIIGGVVAYALKQEKIGGFIVLLGGAALLVGSVMYFFTIQFAGASNYAGTLGSATYSLAVGAWIGGIAGAVGGAVGAGVGLKGLLGK